MRNPDLTSSTSAPAAPPATGGLDRKRLAEAINKVWHGERGRDIIPGPLVESGVPLADAIAAEYARLLAAPAEHVHDWQPTDSQGYSSECVCGEKTSIYP